MIRASGKAGKRIITSIVQANDDNFASFAAQDRFIVASAKQFTGVQSAVGSRDVDRFIEISRQQRRTVYQVVDVILL